MVICKIEFNGKKNMDKKAESFYFLIKLNIAKKLIDLSPLFIIFIINNKTILLH